MEVRYSDQIDADTGGLASNIPVRRCIVAEGEARGASNARKDWRTLVGPIPSSFYGGWSSAFGLMQVAVPECKPDRLEAIAYACELGFLYDDIAEPERETLTQPLSSSIELVHKKAFAQMLALDRPRAEVAIKHWVSFQGALSRQSRVEAMHSIDKYLDYRIIDVGEMLWFGLVTFGMALDIPDRDLIEVRQRTRSCWIALSLQNDICSFAKELRERPSEMVNAITLYMGKGLSEDDAKKETLRLLQLHIRRYQDQVKYALRSRRLVRDSKIYIEALLYTLSGDAAWSLASPRYQYRN